VTAQPRSNRKPTATEKSTRTDWAADEPHDLADRWRRLALAAYSAIDSALDGTPSECTAILAEAASELEGAIDELDAKAGAA